MGAVDGKKTYLLAILYAFGFGAYQSGLLGVFAGTGAFDMPLFVEFLFEGGFIAAIRHALAKLG